MHMCTVYINTLVSMNVKKKIYELLLFKRRFSIAESDNKF